MDLISSILNSMDDPPVMNNAERMRMKKAKEALMKQEQVQKEKLRAFKIKVEEKVNKFLNNETEKKLVFPPIDKLYRTIIHEVATDAGMVTYSFGQEGIDRYCIVYKKEHMPSDDELNALRSGEEWNEEKAKQLAEKRKREKLESERAINQSDFKPATDYKEKYQHLIGLESAKDAARKTGVNKQYGFVPSENKRDVRSIEQTLADLQSKKKFKQGNFGLG